MISLPAQTSRFPPDGQIKVGCVPAFISDELRADWELAVSEYPLNPIDPLS